MLLLLWGSIVRGGVVAARHLLRLLRHLLLLLRLTLNLEAHLRGAGGAWSRPPRSEGGPAQHREAPQGRAPLVSAPAPQGRALPDRPSAQPRPAAHPSQPANTPPATPRSAHLQEGGPVGVGVLRQPEAVGGQVHILDGSEGFKLRGV